jgi:PAS domain S-box-containing protein
MPDPRTGYAKAPINHEDAHLWRERYRMLIERNVAGIVLTTPDGQIVDCNDACARIFGFYAREQMLEKSAWDFYFEKSEREVLVNSLQKNRICPAEEIRLRDRNGQPVWVLATRTVVSVAYGKPELLQGTLIDITAQKQARPRLQHANGLKPQARPPERDSASLPDLSHRLKTLLQRANQTIQPHNLPRLGKPEIREFLFVLEEIKMLMSELETTHALRE